MSEFDQPYKAPAASSDPSRSDCVMAMLAHLLSFVGYFTVIGFILGPLAIYLIKKDASPYVRAHAADAVNFNLSLFLYVLVAAILIYILIGFLLLLLLLLLLICQVLFTVLAAIAAKDGRAYRYPMAIRFIR